MYFYSLFLIILILLFVLNVNSTGLRTRACAFNLQVPYPRFNTGKCTFAYSAATLFNCLDTDLKQIACVSPSSIIFSSGLNNFKHKLFIVFLKGTGSRFSACSLIKMLSFCRDMLYRLCTQYDHVIMLSKNQSAHSNGSYLINLFANSCRFINHGIKPSGQQ